MRPLRFLLSLVASIAAFLCLLYVGPWRPSAESGLHEQSALGTYFNWRTPSSLFPPSAIISLTDDNSTFFLARPAAFGPLIPVKSLSGQLWIGSGFGDDHLGRTGSNAGLEGELGCSDVPGWSDGGYVGQGQSLNEAKSSWAEGQKESVASNGKRSVPDEEDDVEEEAEGTGNNDGTDDHLHHPLPASGGMKKSGVKKTAHADIQSLQESAEIAGKVVLLSRGGCGFLEKVKWVQRRGGVALIVGDDIRGGPLVTMYARGDTSNVTIPSLFTSHTTAHLLSSLIPSGSMAENISPEDARRLDLATGTSDSPQAVVERPKAIDQPNFTTTSSIAKPTVTTESNDQYSSSQVEGSGKQDKSRTGWLSSLFGRSRQAPSDSQPPSTENVGWVLQEEFDDEEVLKYGKKQTTTTLTAAAPSVVPGSDLGDGFVIGIQDWRDPDLVAHQREQLLPSTSTPAVPENSGTPSMNEVKVDSITPGSGEYAKLMQEAGNARKVKDGSKVDGESEQQVTEKKSKGWLRRLFGSSDRENVPESQPNSPERQAAETATPPIRDQPHLASNPDAHEGLWVTLTPTSMSTSPLFDTLLVLVVSPLVTLTVVYALLLLRSRIRRRRWRAPKSVVERLPVRTYQTMASTTPTSSTTSSISSPVSATTPLLPSDARPINARSRPRSRTTPEGPVLAGSSLRSDDMASPSLEQVEEKRAAGLSEWRRRYGGKQRECVVCLEEYVDGVSRVMSLPCGHEFHAECMYVRSRLLIFALTTDLIAERLGLRPVAAPARSAKATSSAPWLAPLAPLRPYHRHLITTTTKTPMRFKKKLR